MEITIIWHPVLPPFLAVLASEASINLIFAHFNLEKKYRNFEALQRFSIYHAEQHPAF
jgi:hypothetical protein